MSIFYFIGNINGDFEAFRRIWLPIRDYLDEGPATLFMSGNFGLSNKKFIEKVDKEVDGLTPIHICGGNAAQEGWMQTPPPKLGKKEIGKNMFVHAFGSGLVISGFSFLMLGRGDTLAQDFYPMPRGCDFAHTPNDFEMTEAERFCKKHPPHVIISHALPSRVCESFSKNLYENDPRKKRLNDPIIPYLDAIERSVSKCYWFGSSLTVQGKRDDKKREMIYTSLMPFASSRFFIASLETYAPDIDEPEKIELGKLIY